jgi:protein-disulfide isomerase
MFLGRQRLLLLAATILFFGILTSGYIWWRVRFSENHYRVGSVPQDIVNRLLPKEIPLESMRPPAIRAQDPLRYGGATSVVSVIEYGDFECEYCKQLAPELRRALSRYGGTVRFVWRDYPITSAHPEAMAAAIFARCAGQQGRFWEAYDLLMDSPALNSRVYSQLGARLRLNDRALSACQKDPSVEAMIKRDMEEATADGIRSAPFLFIGTTAIEGFIDAEAITKAIDDAMASL